MRAVLLTLSAPLRSWGGATVGDTRPSEWAPTQAAVIGLAGAMVGLRRGDPAVADFYAGYDVWAVSGPKANAGSEVGGLAYDFQTISQSVGADGKERDEAIISRRGYLADWIDVVALVPTHRAPVPAEVLVERAQAPSFPLYLGRKAFPLGDSLDAVLVEAEGSALAQQLWNRWVEAGGDPAQGQIFSPAGHLAEMEGFRMYRDRRTDVRNHYGFSERTVNIWKPFKVQPAARRSLEDDAFEQSLAASESNRPSETFDWEQSHG